jgi:hypothetical protein
MRSISKCVASGVLFAAAAAYPQEAVPESLVLLQQRAHLKTDPQGGKGGNDDVDWEKELEGQNINPPILMVSSACVGSSVVMNITKDLLESQGYPIYKSRNELWKPEKNPLADDKTGPGHALLLAAKDATEKKQTLIFKIKSNWLEEHTKPRGALLAMKPKVVAMVRNNTLDQVICRVRDCFDKSSGQAVSPDGTPNHACFERRSTGDKVLAKLNTEELHEIMARKFNFRFKLPRQMSDMGFGKPIVSYYEDLLAYEMDASQLDFSAQRWQTYVAKMGFDLKLEAIRSFLKKSAGSYPKPGSHKDVIYNFAEVDKALQPYPYLHRYLRFPEHGKQTGN